MSRLNAYPKVVKLVLAACVLVALPAAADMELYETELSNVRALPFGFSAVCERSTLKFRSSSSPSFIIRNSILCQLSAAKLRVAERKLFTLCSNDPHNTITTDNRTIPKCSELSLELQQI